MRRISIKQRLLCTASFKRGHTCASLVQTRPFTIFGCDLAVQTCERVVRSHYLSINKITEDVFLAPGY